MLIYEKYTRWGFKSCHRSQKPKQLDSVSTCCQLKHSQRRPSTDEQRKVKFNSTVTVTDGEFKSTDVLRSSNNSGKLLKQRYLGPDYLRFQSPVIRDDSTEFWEMVC